MLRPSDIVLIISRAVIGLAQALIGLRIVLKLLGARTAAPFVRWVYETTQPLLKPFEGMFPSPALEGEFVIEFSALFALLVFSFLGYLVQESVVWMDRFARRENSKRSRD